MAQTYSTQLAGIDSVPAVKASATDGYHARLKRFRATVNLAAQASGDTIVLADVPAGFAFAYGVITASTSLGTSTLAVGPASSANKYRGVTTFTAVDTPTMFGMTPAVGGAVSTASERVLATIGTAALPASGLLVIDMYFTSPH